jgi:hypothetical protein
MPYDEAADFEVPLAPAALPVDVPDPGVFTTDDLGVGLGSRKRVEGSAVNFLLGLDVESTSNEGKIRDCWSVDRF